MAKTAKFRLVKNSGPHKEGGRVYTAGDIVESPLDLIKLFPGKFRRVGGKVESDDDDEEPVTSTKTPYDTAQTKRNPPSPVFESKEEEVVEEVGDDPENPDVDESDDDDDSDDEAPKARRKKAKGKK